MDGKKIIVKNLLISTVVAIVGSVVSLVVGLPLSAIIIGIIAPGIGMGGLILMPLVSLFFWLAFLAICTYASWVMIKNSKYALITVLVFVIVSASMGFYGKYTTESSVKTFQSNVSKAIGDGTIMVTYKGTIKLPKNLKAIFEVKSADSGDYQISGDLLAKNPPGIIGTTSSTLVTLDKDISKTVEFSFDLSPFIEVGYAGDYKFIFSVWRKNINISGVWGQKNRDSWQIKVVDSGKSPNVSTTKDYGAEMPLYTIN